MSFEYCEYDNYLPYFAQPALDFLAPEYILQRRCEFASDRFSLGCLAVACYNRGNSVMQNRNNLLTYKQGVERLSQVSLMATPAELARTVRGLLTAEFENRVSLEEFQKCNFFTSSILMCSIVEMERLCEKTPVNKAKFLKDFARVLPQYHDHTLYRKVLPYLLDETKDPLLLPFLLPDLYLIFEKLTPRQFAEKAADELKPVFATREPIQAVAAILHGLPLLISKSSKDYLKNVVLPFVFAVLDSENVKVQDKALSVVPSLTGLLDFTNVKNGLFPRVLALYSKSKVVSVKINCLICFASFVEVLDKFSVTEKMLPAMKDAPMQQPGVLMALLGTYDKLARCLLDTDLIATEVLPRLWSLSISKTLNVSQFQKFMNIVRELATMVEVTHVAQLGEVERIEDQLNDADTRDSPLDAEQGLNCLLISFLLEFISPIVVAFESYEELVANQQKKPPPMAARPSATSGDPSLIGNSSARRASAGSAGQFSKPALVPQQPSTWETITATAKLANLALSSPAARQAMSAAVRAQTRPPSQTATSQKDVVDLFDPLGSSKTNS